MGYKAFVKNILLKISPSYRVTNHIRVELEQIKQMLSHYHPGGFYLNQNGFCPVCEQNTAFFSDKAWLRDNFVCSNCGSIPRHRALVLILEKYYPNWRHLRIHESSPGVSAITKKFTTECRGYTASQFYQKKQLGEIIDGYRNENLEKQTYNDGSFDIVITQDVFEHVFNPDKAFSEIARTLKQGGAHIFTVPIANKFNKTEIWAKQDDNGEPVFLKTEEWHTDQEKEAFPVTVHWGFDIVDYIKDSCGLDTNIEYLFNLLYGVWAEHIEVFVSKKH